ncbi:hypothetical protein [Blastopirellula marina]|nr:hypothetical protein [Blastopirellula marina]
MASTLRIFGLCMTTWLVVGCSNQVLLDGAAKTTVTVTLDDAPVEEAAVVFTPVEGGRSASGRTDVSGVAQMGTARVGDGVFPGEYKIVIVKSIDDPSTPPPAEEDQHEHTGRGRPVYAKQIYLVPKKYISTSTSDLSTVVEADVENEVTLKLNSK